MELFKQTHVERWGACKLDISLNNETNSFLHVTFSNRQCTSGLSHTAFRKHLEKMLLLVIPRRFTNLKTHFQTYIHLKTSLPASGPLWMWLKGPIPELWLPLLVMWGCVSSLLNLRGLKQNFLRGEIYLPLIVSLQILKDTYTHTHKSQFSLQDIFLFHHMPLYCAP